MWGRDPWIVVNLPSPTFITRLDLWSLGGSPSGSYNLYVWSSTCPWRDSGPCGAWVVNRVILGGNQSLTVNAVAGSLRIGAATSGQASTLSIGEAELWGP